MDDGRPLRPLWHLGGGVGQGKWPRVMREYHETKTALPAWRDLVCGTFPPTREFEITSSAFVDPLFSAEKHTLEDYEKLLVPHCGAIEYVDPYEGNEAYISWWGRADALQAEHTHSEIHPSTLLGLLASMIPFSNHNQSPRNQLSCSQSKQSIGYYATNFENRFDTYGSMLCYGEGPLCRTIVYDAVGGGAMPYGANIIFAINSFNGYNQDDGILFNRSSIERGLFRSLALRSYTTVEEEDPITKAVYRIGNPRNILAWTDLKPGNDYSQLDDNGIIREGVAIHDHTVLVGRYMLNRETGHISDASLTPTVFTNGRVDKVVVLHQANGMRLVRIRILEERVPELGDKFCLTPDHEVLTGNRGWVGIADIELTDTVCCLKPTDNSIYYTNPVNKVQFVCDNEPMYDLDSQQVQLMTTQNHKMWVQRRGRTEYELLEAKDIMGKRVRYMKDGLNTNPEYPTANTLDIKDFEKLPDWVFNLSQSQSRGVLDTILKESQNDIYISDSKVLCDDIQRLCLHAGYSANIQKHQSQWSVEIYRSDNHPIVNEEDETIVGYTGSVHCIEVPEHIFYVRRNGVPVWTGNSSRHGQKGTIGMLLDAQDMPRTADGMVPDVMVNPHCIPSRMTIAQLLEQVFGKLGAHIGAKMNATPFMNDQQSYTAIADALESLGIQRDGEEILYSGITGKMFTSSVFMGPLYFMRIKHLVQDKLNVRGPGRREQLTHQPTGGRGNEGGMRIGEMERDSLIAHGIADFLQESMMKRSDGTSFVVCNGCGTIPIYNEDFKFYVCSLCDGPLTWQGTTPETKSIVLPVRKSRTTFSRVEIPYALKLCDQELTTYMNAGYRFLTAKMARHFREPTEDTIEELFEAQVLEDKAEVMDEDVEVPEEKPRTKRKNMKFKKTGNGTTDDVDKPDDIAAAEDAPKDLIDEGQPAHNESAAVPEYPPGTQIIDFTAATKEYKEFTTYFPVNLAINDKVWPSVEHYFQAMKFPDNAEFQERLRLTDKPAEVKRLAKTMEQTQRPDWNTYRDEVMYIALKEKFSGTHPELKAKLLSTGNAIIRDGSPQDNYWGIGRSKKGKNRLGVLIMKVRDELATAVPVAVPAVGAGVSDLDAMMTRTTVKEENATALAVAAAAAAAATEANPANAITVNIGAIPGASTEHVAAPVVAPVNMDNPTFPTEAEAEAEAEAGAGAVAVKPVKAVKAVKPVAAVPNPVTVTVQEAPRDLSVPVPVPINPVLPTIPPITVPQAAVPYVPSANPPVLRIDEVSATEQIPESEFKTITVTAPFTGKK